jgi:hypothetical protein
MNMTFTDLRGWGATVAGHPIVGADPRLVEDLQRTHHALRTMRELAAAITETLRDAQDGTDEGHQPGDLYWTVVRLIEPDGVTDVHIQAERTERGYVVYYPTVTDNQETR